jgi:hypothetical protein
MDGSTPVLEPECIQDQMIRISNAISSIDKEIVALGERIRELNERRDLMVAENRCLAWELKQRVYF